MSSPLRIPPRHCRFARMHENPSTAWSTHFAPGVILTRGTQGLFFFRNGSSLIGDSMPSPTQIARAAALFFSITQMGLPQETASTKSNDAFLYTRSDAHIISQFAKGAKINTQPLTVGDFEKSSPGQSNIKVRGPVRDAYQQFKSMCQAGDEIHSWEDRNQTIPIPSSLLGYQYNKSHDIPRENAVSAQRAQPVSRYVTRPDAGPSVNRVSAESEYIPSGICIMRDNQVHAVLIVSLRQK